MSNSWEHYSLNGCIFETRPSAAPELRASAQRLPPVVDLRAHCSPVEDQMRTQSCVANAIVGALEFHQNKAGLPLTDLSRLFVYYNARALARNESKDCGTQIHHGMAALLAYGACEARRWPFREDAVTISPTQDCFENASHYEAIQYARTRLGESAMAVLAQGLPIVFGMFAPVDYYQIAAQTGVMPKPSQVTPTQPPAGHSMLIVGYDQTDRTYLIRNSYGAGFADKGYFKAPFETLEAWSRPEDFWTIGAIEQAEGMNLSGPSMIDAMKELGAPVDSLLAGRDAIQSFRSDLRSKLNSELESAKRDFRDRLRGR